MKVIAKDIKKFAADVWYNGHAGGARCKIKYVQPIPAEKIIEIKAALRPLVEKKLAEYAALPKSVLNKTFISDFLKVRVKLFPDDIYESELFIETYDNFYATKYVRGREIKSLMPLDYIMEHAPICMYDNSDGHSTTTYHPFSQGADGAWTYTTYGRIEQPSIEITRKNWCRARMRKQFETLVYDTINDRVANGWELIDAAYVGRDYVKKPIITFKRVA